MDETKTQSMIDLAIKQYGSFSNKKIGDTPTDDYQLTPKKYVDTLVGTGTVSNVWGDASDGTAVLDGSSVVGFASIIASNTYVLKRDAYLGSLTLNTGVTLRTNSYRVFAQSAVTNAGIIRNTGNAGGDAAVGTPGAGGPSILAASLGNSGAGIIGSNPTDASDISSSWGGKGGNGGNSASSGSAGGSVFAALTRPLSPTFMAMPYDIVNSSIISVKGGAGGGSGGLGGIGNNSGGGGGGGGGLLLISAPTITNTGSVVSLGGKGGNGVFQATPPGGAGGGGGGGGGIFLFYKTLTNTGTIATTGGVGGTGASGGGNGSPGSDGNIFTIQV